MGASHSVRAVVAAIAGNSFVCLIKFIAFFLSGSGAMLSEAIHSLADTGNQLLLFIGLKRGQREADDRFHYGYGGERFIFGMLSAAGIFFIGCGITVYHGITALITPHMPELTVVTFVVLGVAFVIEGGVLLIAVRTLARQRGEMPFWYYVRERADPAAVAILLEDSVAVLGVCLAAAGIGAAYLTGNPVWDAIASLVIGALLGFVAFYLVGENRELLLGRAVPEGVEGRFIDILLNHPSVRSVRDVKTRELTPETFLFKAEITLDNDYIAEQISRQSMEKISLEGNKRDRALRRLSALVTDLIATEIHQIELDVRKEIPQAKHIDLEVAHPDMVPPDDDELLA